MGIAPADNRGPDDSRHTLGDQILFEGRNTCQGLRGGPVRCNRAEVYNGVRVTGVWVRAR